MPTATTRPSSAPPTLHLALHLGNSIWKLAFATSHVHATRLRTRGCAASPQPRHRRSAAIGGDRRTHGHAPCERRHAPGDDG